MKKQSILVNPSAAPCKDIDAQLYNTEQLARFAGRLSYMVDQQLGLTPQQLRDVVKTLDRFCGLGEEVV